jgi:hypothetical protein
MKPIQE